MNIFCFGDSITQGFYDSRGGWVQRLSSNLHARTLGSMKSGEGFFVQVYNLGVSGDTIARLSNRIDSELKSRLDSNKNIIILNVGINDSVLFENKAFIDIYEFQQQYESLVGEAKKFSDKLLLVGLNSVDEKLADPWIYDREGVQFKNNRINLFEDCIKQIALNSDIPFVAVHDKFFSATEKGFNLLSDGLHPNDEGHDFIYQLVLPEIESFLNK